MSGVRISQGAPFPTNVFVLGWGVNFVNQLFHRYFYAPESATRLNLFRFLFCMALPYTERNVFGKINKIHSIAEYNPWTLFSYVLDKPLSLEAFNICFYLFVLCSVLSALGIFTRLSLSLTSIFYFLAIGTYLSFTKSPNTDYVSHSRNILVWIPLLLAISPGIKEYTLLNIQKWSGQFRSGLQIPNFGTQMVITTLALAYFAAGYCKVSKDLFWADGYTLQSYLYVKYLLLDIDLARTVAQSFWLCLVGRLWLLSLGFCWLYSSKN